MDDEYKHKETIQDLTNQLSHKHAEWVNQNLLNIANGFTYKGKTKRERKREFERYVKKHVTMKQVAQPQPKSPHDPEHECNYFEWVLYERGKEISRLKVELTHKEPNDEHLRN